MGFKMKKLIYMVPILLCASNSFAKNFGGGFACGSFAGFASGMIANEMTRYRQPNRPSLYVVSPPRPQPSVYVVPQPVQPQVVYYEQPAHFNHTTETRIIKNESKYEVEAKQLELQIMKEANRKKELALREKELDIQLFKLKQV